MLAHLLKLIWKRKSRNLLIMLEIALAFVLVFGVVAFATRSAHVAIISICHFAGSVHYATHYPYFQTGKMGCFFFNARYDTL